jgi:hypothetical protein
MQVIAEAPKEVPIERIPYEEPLPFPRTATRHIRTQLLAEQKEEEVEEVRAPEANFGNKEPTYEVAYEGEVTKEGILAMYAHCKEVELDSEASQFVEGMVKAKNMGKHVLPCTFGGSSYFGLCDIGAAVMLFLIVFLKYSR